jgi:hypothetical protein
LATLSLDVAAAITELWAHGLFIAQFSSRTRLALVILALAREGSRNEREIRKLAVKYMTSSERPPAYAVGH